MKHLPKVLLPVAILLFVTSVKAAPTCGPGTEPFVACGPVSDLTKGIAGGLFIATVMYALENQYNIPKGYMQTPVKYRVNGSMWAETSAVDYCINADKYAGRTKGPLPDCSK